MKTALKLITRMAEGDPTLRFTTLIHHLNVNNLMQCFRELKRNKAPGVDGVTLEDYEKNLKQNLTELVARMKAWRYRPQPVLRVYIAKPEGGQRPLGVPAVEDKIVQMGITRILQAIFEVDFLPNSYGFRQGRGCHDALKALNSTLRNHAVNYIVDADIKGYFDNVDHKWLMKFLERRIVDRNFLRLIGRFLRADVVEDGKRIRTPKGTPQGGILSPVLSNIYLHYVLDLWFENDVKPRLKGTAFLNRYADDFVLGFQAESEAKRVLQALRHRLAEFGLELSEKKTRCIAFGRYAAENTRRRGKRKPETFDYLGFTHYCDRTGRGGFKVGRRTSRKKLRAKLIAMNQWLKYIRNRAKVAEWWPILRVKLLGHFRYYGVSGNSYSLTQYYWRVVGMVFRWINSRSQHSSYTWPEFLRYLLRFPLPKPRVYCRFY